MANVTFNITVAATQLAYTPSSGNYNAIRTVWELSYPTHASAIATACAQTAGATVTVEDQGNSDDTGELAARAAHMKVDGNLAASSMKVDFNTTAYRPGEGGSHGGGAALLDRLANTTIAHPVTVSGTNYTVYPGVKINVVPIS